MGWAAYASGAAVEPVLSLSQKEKPAFLDTLKELVSIESGSADREGLDRIADLIAGRLRSLGGKVELIEPGADVYKMFDTPERVGKMVPVPVNVARTIYPTRSGVSNILKKILLIAHMDTVYPRGMLAKQPFRIDGERAYGLGIADDKHGVALILHGLAILKAMNFSEYETLTVFINGDEEVSSPASRHHFTRLAVEQDAVMSFEGTPVKTDQVRLATSGVAAATVTVRGRASHAGSAPELGVNSLYELAHQLLQMRDLSEPAVGLKVNWTLAKAGVVRNMIPPEAHAQADIRVERVSDYDGIEQKLKERVKSRLLPDAKVELDFERRRPPLQATDAARALASHAQRIYAELGKQLIVQDRPSGGGTDAAFAALKTKAPVIEGFGLQGFGAHSTEAEYVLIGSIEPRLYLAVRMIMEIAQGKAR